MKLQIRTKDNLVELLKKGISHAWRVNKGRLNSITEVEIYDFRGQEKISGIFDLEHSLVLENGRVAVAFKEGKIEKANYKWVGQNPIKYVINNQEVALMGDEKEQESENHCFEIYLNHIDESSIDEKYKIKLSKPYFAALSKHLCFIELMFANTEEAMDEFGADEYYKILFDIKNSQILPLNYFELKESKGSQEAIFNAYTGTSLAAIPISYIQNEDYWGTWIVTSRTEGHNWELSFHGSYESSYGSVEEDFLKDTKEAFSSREVFRFIAEAINKIKNQS